MLLKYFFHINLFRCWKPNKNWYNIIISLTSYNSVSCTTVYNRHYVNNEQNFNQRGRKLPGKRKLFIGFLSDFYHQKFVIIFYILHLKNHSCYMRNIFPLQRYIRIETNSPVRTFKKYAKMK